MAETPTHKLGGSHPSPFAFTQAKLNQNEKKKKREGVSSPSLAFDMKQERKDDYKDTEVSGVKVEGGDGHGKKGLGLVSTKSWVQVGSISRAKKSVSE